MWSKCLHREFASGHIVILLVVCQTELNFNPKRNEECFRAFQHRKCFFKVKTFQYESVSPFVQTNHYRNQHGNSCHSILPHKIFRSPKLMNWLKDSWTIRQRISIRLNSFAQRRCFWHDNHFTSSKTLLLVVLLLNCISLLFVNVCSVIWNGFSDGKTFPEWTWSFSLKKKKH